MLVNNTSVVLSAEQQAAVDKIVKNPRKNFILTGKAGAGKSTVINELRKQVSVFISATTGVAAMNVGGCTVDTLFALQRAPEMRIRDFGRLRMNMGKVSSRIVIDECSMVGSNMARCIEHIPEQFDKQFILVGDFAQAAPVKEPFGVTSKLFMESDVIQLQESHRQSDGEFLTHLNHVRVGDCPEDSTRFFLEHVRELPDDLTDTTMRLFATNKLVDSYNVSQLAKISAPSVSVTARFIDQRAPSVVERYPIPADRVAKTLADSPMAHNDSFKIGCRVMMTLNVYNPIDNSAAFVNGDLGEVVDILDTMGNSLKGYKPVLGRPAHVGGFIVKLDRTGNECQVTRTVLEQRDVSGGVISSVDGFPIRLGYACSVHKAQGLTLDRVWIDTESITYHPQESRHGLLYVALSRVRSADGLYLANWRPDAVYCAPEVRAFVR